MLIAKTRNFRNFDPENKGLSKFDRANKELTGWIEQINNLAEKGSFHGIFRDAVAFLCLEFNVQHSALRKQKICEILIVKTKDLANLIVQTKDLAHLRGVFTTEYTENTETSKKAPEKAKGAARGYAFAGNFGSLFSIAKPGKLTALGKPMIGCWLVAGGG